MRARLLLMAAAALATGVILLLVFALGHRDMRRVRGELESRGAGWDTWSRTPSSCALDPQDGLAPGASSTRLTLLWLDPEAGDQTRYQRWFTSPDTPLRLDLVAWPPGSRQVSLAVLETVKHNGPLLLDATVCSRLELETETQAPLVREGRPALAGTLTLACSTAGRQLSGTIHFDHCGF